MRSPRRDVYVRIGRVVVDAAAIEHGRLNAGEFSAALKAAITRQLAPGMVDTSASAQVATAPGGLVQTIASAVASHVRPPVAGRGTHET